MDATISIDSHCDGWRQAKENTSSGPSGITFAHFKAGALDPVIADFEACMTAIPYISGISPARWRKGTNVMLEKQKGNFNVEKLRAILLYEADFNQNNKKLGKEMMYTAERLQAIALEQFGSRNKLSASNQSLNKRLTFDLIQQKKRPAALCSNDAKSCYDRIVHSVASLCMQRLGVPPAPIVCMFTTIQNLEHRIRTIYGDSKIGFSGALWAVPIQGVGQGNGAGPQIWAAVSTPVLNLLREEGYGAYFQPAISAEKLSFVGYAFVDDTDLLSVLEDKEADYRRVAEHMQEALAAWERGIRATGGAIVPEKSHWYLIDFKWTNGHWRYALIDDSPASISVKDSEGNVKVLQRLSANEARRSLGVCLAPDGNNNAEFLELVDKAKIWADSIRTGHLPRHLVWESMKTTVLKSIQYSLPTTTLQYDQCRKIMSTLLKAALPGSGIIRTLPRDLVYGPLKYQGLAVPCLYTHQQVEHILRILKFCHASMHLTARLIRQSLEATKLEIGCKGPLLSRNFAEFGRLATPTWITHTWEFLSNNGMRIHDDVPDCKMQRERDQFLIEALYQSGVTGEYLRRVNLCRLFLRVVTVSDIATGCGEFVTKSAWEGKDDLLRNKNFDWPAQGRPSPGDWDAWRNALQSLCTSQRRLRSPLGRWLDRSHSEWFFDPGAERLFFREAGRAIRFPRAIGRATTRFSVCRFNSLEAQEVENIPMSALPATIERSRSVIIVTGYAEVARSEVGMDQTLAEYISCNLHVNARWAVENFLSTDNGKYVADAIVNGTCIAVSDGSFKDNSGTAAWSIWGESDAFSLSGSCVVPGQAQDQSAYRSELSGLYAIAVMVEAVCKVFRIQSGSIEIGCDGISALRQATAETDLSNPHLSQFDLIAAIRHIIHRTPIKWKARHVKGHQDDDETIVLDRWALINIDMDLKAKEHWHRMQSDRSTPGFIQQEIYGEPWSFWVGPRKISQRFREEVIEHIQGKAVKKYWDGKKRFGGKSSADIDWNATKKAMESVPLSRKRWVSKHASGFCAVGKMMLKWKKRETDECPRCGASEDVEHVIRCRGEGSDEIWENSISQLRVWMTTQKTLGSMADVICDRLSAWRLGTQPTVQTSTFRGLRKVVDDQDECGWKAFLDGTPVIGWANVQQSFYEWKGSRRMGQRWLSALIQKMWDVAWDQWQFRNKVLHDREEGMLALQRQAEIREQFRMGSRSLSWEVKRLFLNGLDVILAYRPERKYKVLNSLLKSITRRDISPDAKTSAITLASYR